MASPLLGKEGKTGMFRVTLADGHVEEVYVDEEGPHMLQIDGQSKSYMHSPDMAAMTKVCKIQKSSWDQMSCTEKEVVLTIAAKRNRGIKATSDVASRAPRPGTSQPSVAAPAPPQPAQLAAAECWRCHLLEAPSPKGPCSR
eukprot:CAMPEP_0197910912 /NCGR_PEP_ID=MMETSP1439-20131203/71812_1 /TAXON_ID=66791 /ORGANISM="Gonyaulax spinifera, Strain CCMP409" /LENGTH=141 /DNA_ID=CAMNT_0043532611 /DNA_START=54 /DNA_END=476 /DNA_ORIENTATION=+